MDVLNTIGRRFRVRTLALLAVSFTSLFAHGADGDSVRAQQMKAATIYKFTRYIHWPDSADRSTDEKASSICLLGKDPFDGALQDLQNATKITVRQVEDNSETLDCRMLVISESEQDTLDQILKELRGKSVVTISEIDGFTDRGGMINLFSKNNRIRFDINQSAARESHLRFDLRLIRLSASAKE